MHAEVGSETSYFSLKTTVNTARVTQDYDFILSSEIFDEFVSSLRKVIERTSLYRVHYDKILVLSGGNCKGLKLWKMIIEHIEEYKYIEFDFREQKFISENGADCPIFNPKKSSPTNTRDTSARASKMTSWPEISRSMDSTTTSPPRKSWILWAHSRISKKENWTWLTTLRPHLKTVKNDFLTNLDANRYPRMLRFASKYKLKFNKQLDFIGQIVFKVIDNF